MTFGEKLQSLRQKAGMSQDALAEKLDVSRQAVSRWERDETMPETDKVVSLADLFGVTTDYLLRDSVTEQSASTGVSRERGILDQLGYLLKARGYLLGWLLILWGLRDLLPFLLLLISYFSCGRPTSSVVSIG